MELFVPKNMISDLFVPTDSASTSAIGAYFILEKAVSADFTE
jgi:hypothetical protein